MSRTRLFVVDDNHGTLGEALRAASALGQFVTTTAMTMAEADAIMQAEGPFDIALVDLGLPDGSGVDLLRRWSVQYPGMPCIAYTVFEDDATLFSALAAGATGYILKGQTGDSLCAHLVTAKLGEPVISPSIARRVLAYFRGGAPSKAPVAPESDAAALSPREAEVLALVARGLTISEVAEQLTLSVNTIRTHVKGAYAKLGVHSRTGALREAQRLGLLDG